MQNLRRRWIQALVVLLLLVAADPRRLRVAVVRRSPAYGPGRGSRGVAAADPTGDGSSTRPALPRDAAAHLGLRPGRVPAAAAGDGRPEGRLLFALPLHYSRRGIGSLGLRPQARASINDRREYGRPSWSARACGFAAASTVRCASLRQDRSAVPAGSSRLPERRDGQDFAVGTCLLRVGS